MFPYFGFGPPVLYGPPVVVGPSVFVGAPVLFGGGHVCFSGHCCCCDDEGSSARRVHLSGRTGRECWVPEMDDDLFATWVEWQMQMGNKDLSRRERKDILMRCLRIHAPRWYLSGSNAGRAINGLMELDESCNRDDDSPSRPSRVSESDSRVSIGTTTRTATTTTITATPEQRQQFGNELMQQLNSQGSQIGVDQATKMLQEIWSGKKDAQIYTYFQSQRPEEQQRATKELRQATSAIQQATSDLQRTRLLVEQYQKQQQQQSSAPVQQQQPALPGSQHYSQYAQQAVQQRSSAATMQPQTGALPARQQYASAPNQAQLQNAAANDLLHHSTTTTTITSLLGHQPQNYQMQPMQNSVPQNYQQTMEGQPPAPQPGYQQPVPQLGYQQPLSITAGPSQMPGTPGQLPNQGQQPQQAAYQLPGLQGSQNAAVANQSSQAPMQYGQLDQQPQQGQMMLMGGQSFPQGQQAYQQQPSQPQPPHNQPYAMAPPQQRTSNSQAPVAPYFGQAQGMPGQQRKSSHRR